MFSGWGRCRTGLRRACSTLRTLNRGDDRNLEPFDSRQRSSRPVRDHSTPARGHSRPARSHSTPDKSRSRPARSGSGLDRSLRGLDRGHPGLEWRGSILSGRGRGPDGRSSNSGLEVSNSGGEVSPLEGEASRLDRSDAGLSGHTCGPGWRVFILGLKGSGPGADGFWLSRHGHETGAIRRSAARIAPPLPIA